MPYTAYNPTENAMIALRPMLLVLALALAAQAADAEPNQGGPLRLVSASVYGGQGEDRITGVAIQSDRSVVAVGACEAPFSLPGLAKPTSGKGLGFILRLDAWGKPRAIRFMPKAQAVVRVGPQDRIYVRDDAGTVSILDADLRKELGSFEAPPADKIAMAVDATGEVAVVSGNKLMRWSATGKQLWAVTPPAYGGNRLRACAMDDATGITMVTGYGMTHTGKEPYKDPYAHGYDRTGKRVWTLWNPEPGRQKAGEFGGNGLMADGTGDIASSTPDGKFLVHVHHDGGNAITNRDPTDALKPLDPKVLSGAYQDGPGWGMKGAITTSVIFRLDPATGRLEKGTWMCAWLNNHSQANTLFMYDAAADERGDVFVVGSSAGGLPTKMPWFTYREGEYTGGGYLAAFNTDFAKLQCGPFNPGAMLGVAARDGVVVVVGRADGTNKKGEPLDAGLRMRLFPGGSPAEVVGRSDGFIAILHRKGATIPSTTTAKPGKSAKSTATTTNPAGKVTAMASDPSWDRSLLVQLQRALAAGRTVDVELSGATSQLIACNRDAITVRSGQSELAIAARVLTMSQRIGLARELADGGDAMDLLVAAYFVRLGGDTPGSDLLLAKAGKQISDLEQAPPGDKP